MALILRFNYPDFTPATYDEAVKQLRAAGAGAPKGRNYHVCSDNPAGGLIITDVWESKEDFEAFGAELIPIMQRLGIDPGQPDYQQVHNIIMG
jgi:hypothetical protein